MNAIFKTVAARLVLRVRELGDASRSMGYKDASNKADWRDLGTTGAGEGARIKEVAGHEVLGMGGVYSPGPEVTKVMWVMGAIW